MEFFRNVTQKSTYETDSTTFCKQIWFSSLFLNYASLQIYLKRNNQCERCSVLLKIHFGLAFLDKIGFMLRKIK
jgi:hypothetical protein